MKTENTIRKQWCNRLWKRKGYDSPAEFMDKGNCFACGLDDGDKLQPRNVSQGKGDSPHLLCGICHDDSEGLKGFAYFRWFLRRTATDMIATAMTRRVVVATATSV